MMRNRSRFDPTHVAVTRAAVIAGVGIEKLPPASRKRNADLIIVAGDRREVEDRHERLPFVIASTDETDHAVLGIAAIDPFKTRRVVILLMQRGKLAIELVQLGNQLEQSFVSGVLQKLPLQTPVMIPFAPLAKLASHEEKFLAGLRIHVGEQKPQIGESLPRI